MFLTVLGPTPGHVKSKQPVQEKQADRVSARNEVCFAGKNHWGLTVRTPLAAEGD